MAPAQSPPIPPPGTRPRLADCGWLSVYLARGFFELVRARIAFARLAAADIPRRNRAASLASGGAAPHEAAVTTARIGYVLPRISARVPWRSDCLVQAIAAQNWLAADGLVSEIRIGVERPEGSPFGAHAWLVHGAQVVTGGEIGRYHVLLTEDPSAGPNPSRPADRDTCG